MASLRAHSESEFLSLYGFLLCRPPSNTLSTNYWSSTTAEVDGKAEAMKRSSQSSIPYQPSPKPERSTRAYVSCWAVVSEESCFGSEHWGLSYSTPVSHC